ncbi:MAG: hypothetical protein ACK2UQ_16365 [Anaerolineae bacterium]
MAMVADSGAQDARFTFSGFAVSGQPDPFGVWKAPTQRDKSPDEDGLMWRVALPDAASALDVVYARTDALRRGEDDLAQAEAELHAMLAGVKSTEGAERGLTEAVSYAFSVPAAEDFHPQKDALRKTLAGLAMVETSPVTGAVAFGAVDTFAEEEEHKGFREAHRRWLAFVEQVQQMVAHYARVETVIAGAPVGLTRVGWSGDFETFWVPGMPALSREAHHETVNLALASRIALLRVVSVVTTGAAGLILKAVALPPGGQVLLIPAARRFILDVMAVLRERRQVDGRQ